MTILSAILASIFAVAYSKFVFSDIAIYGPNLCDIEGLGPNVRKIELKGHGCNEEKPLASLVFDGNDEIIINARDNGSAGFLKHASLMTGEDVEENMSNGDRGLVVSKVETGDFVMAIVKHSPDLKLNHVQYDSVFKGHGDDTVALTKMFVDKYGHEGSFTLITALVKEASEGQEPYYSLIPDLA